MIAALAPLATSAAPRCATADEQQRSADGERERILPPGSVIWAARAEPLPSPPAPPPLETLDDALRPLEYEWRHEEAAAPWFGDDADCPDCKRPLWAFAGLPRMWTPVGDGRHRGIGDPLVGTSWLNRPYSFGLFTGGLFGGTLVPNDIDQRGGLLTGLRVGVDLHHYLGVETRLGFSHTDSLFLANGGTSTIDDALLDANLLYYPLGDARWRPYASLGIGLHRFEYYDTLYQKTVDTLLQMPIGLGVKYHLHNWMSIRLDMRDNLAFGQRDLATMNNFSVTGGIEFRFGGRRTTYFPFDPSISPR